MRRKKKATKKRKEQRGKKEGFVMSINSSWALEEEGGEVGCTLRGGGKRPSCFLKRGEHCRGVWGGGGG